MAEKTGRFAIVEQLLADGITYMFGNPGTVEQGFLDALGSYPEMRYVLATTGPSDQGPPSEPGFINGGLLERGAPVTGPVLTLEVEDIDAALATVERLGGVTVSARQAVGEMGFSAYFTDTEGNLMGLWQRA